MTQGGLLSSLFARLRGRTIPATSEDALRRYLSRLSDREAELSTQAFLAGAIGYYRDEPLAGIVREPDADMLLFQYGTYDWGEGPAFEVDVTRQFAHDHEGTLSQLHATAYYTPEPDLRALGAHHEWLHQRADADSFAQQILANPAVAAIRDRAPLRRVIRWGLV